MIPLKTLLTVSIVFMHYFDPTLEWLRSHAIPTPNNFDFFNRYIFNSNTQFPVHCFSFMSAYFSYNLLMNPSFKATFKRLKPDLILTLPIIPLSLYLAGKPFAFVYTSGVYWFFWQWVVFLLTITLLSLCFRNKSVALVGISLVTLLIGSTGVLKYLYGHYYPFLTIPAINAQYLCFGLWFSYLNSGALNLTTTKSSFYEKWVLRFIFYYHQVLLRFIA